MKVDRDVRKRPSCVCIYCVCASVCVCVHNVNVFWAYVTLGTTCVWKRDAAVVCDVFDGTHSAANLHLFITRTCTHIQGCM